MNEAAPALKPRIHSLDQFRGYTVAGMFLVNFLGGFQNAPFLCKHHLTFCSYADTIMPHFFFAVGFAFRLSFGRRLNIDGTVKAYAHVVKRLLGLALVAFVVYTVGRQTDPWTWENFSGGGYWDVLHVASKQIWFQTLLHIAATSLWILPVIRASFRWRLAYMIGSALLHVVLSHVFYFDWIHTAPDAIDGGPLGFLTWTMPTMIGTFACDAVLVESGRPRLVKMMFWAIVMMGLGYGFSSGTRWYDVPADRVDALSEQRTAKSPIIPEGDGFARWQDAIANGKWSEVLAEPPFVPPPHSQSGSDGADESQKYRKWNYWMMGQCVGSISYLTFSSGLSLAVYVFFYVLSDMMGVRIGIFRTLGTNALIGYILHGLVDRAVTSFMPPDSPTTYMYTGFVVYFWITWLFLRNLEKHDIYVKL